MFDSLVSWLESIGPVNAALVATLFTWLMTMAGASLVVFFKTMHRRLFDGMLGFTGGVMVAASFWSLLAPSIDMSEGEGLIKVIPAATGFLLGALFIFALDKLTPHLHINFKEDEAEGPKTDWHSTTLLVLAITLPNIRKDYCGSFIWWSSFRNGWCYHAGALALAIGIGIQTSQKVLPFLCL